MTRPKVPISLVQGMDGSAAWQQLAHLPSTPLSLWGAPRLTAAQHPPPEAERDAEEGQPVLRRSPPSPRGLASSRLEPKPCIDPRCILNPAAAEASGFQRQGGGASPWASRLWHRSETPALLPQPVPRQLAQGPCPHQRFKGDARALSVGKGPPGLCGVPGVALQKGI